MAQHRHKKFIRNCLIYVIVALYWLKYTLTQAQAINRLFPANIQIN